MSIYLAVRKVIEPSWVNNRDQFLNPNKNWQNDIEFQNDCLAFTLFHNIIQSEFGVNNWIPFTEQEVNAKEKFASNFMTNFINGKLKKIEPSTVNSLFDDEIENIVYDNKQRQFSAEASTVFDAGRELWKYYHSQNDVDVNASFYDIREYFQGRNDIGKMNSKSENEKYSELISDLRNKLNLLADKIKPKVFEYEFLKE